MCSGNSNAVFTARTDDGFVFRQTPQRILKEPTAHECSNAHSCHRPSLYCPTRLCKPRAGTSSDEDVGGPVASCIK